MPFSVPLLNYMEIFNELCVLMATYTLLFFTDAYADSDLQYKIGWITVGMTMLNIGLNTLIIFIQTILTLKSNVRKIKAKVQKLLDWIKNRGKPKEKTKKAPYCQNSDWVSDMNISRA